MRKNKPLSYLEFLLLVGASLSLGWWIVISGISLWLPELGILKDVEFGKQVWKVVILVWVGLSWGLIWLRKPKLKWQKGEVLVGGLVGLMWGLSFKQDGWEWVLGVSLISWWTMLFWQRLSEDWGWIKIKREWWKNTLIGGLVLGTVVSLGIYKISQTINEKRAWWGDYPTIEKVEPMVVFPSSKVVIKGNHFSWPQDKYSQPKLMSDLGEIRVDLWTNEKVVFTVPISWKGEVNIWIEKYRNWKGEKILNKSDKWKLKVLDANNLSNKDEKLYYQEMEKVSEEVKKLNGW